ncbi:MAG: SDR family NAD(P)-dependent oxidoreductase [Hyphomicrobiales bacterium]|nr:SDR family NAD(P)-dependent oxidoreductase [Hyphomicrobiales bacterium]
MEKKLKNKNILITGASNGIGKQIALSYGKNNANIIALGQSQSALEDLDKALSLYGNSATLVPIDLKNYQFISELAEKLGERLDKLDALILNAATLGSLGPVTHIDEYEWNNTFSINLTSNIIILKVFEYLIKKSETPQIFFMTSNIINEKKPFWGLYSATKAALEKIAYSYASEVENIKIKVNLIDPGKVNTKLREKAYPGENKSTLTQPNELSDFFVDIIFNEKYSSGELISFEKWKHPNK